MLATEKALLMVGGTTTFNEAVLEGVPGPLSFEVIIPVVLSLVGILVGVTFTETVQPAPCASSTPSIDKLNAPAARAGLKVAFVPHSGAMS